MRKKFMIIAALPVIAACGHQPAPAAPGGTVTAAPPPAAAPAPSDETPAQLIASQMAYQPEAAGAASITCTSMVTPVLWGCAITRQNGTVNRYTVTTRPGWQPGQPFSGITGP